MQPEVHSQQSWLIEGMAMQLLGHVDEKVREWSTEIFSQIVIEVTKLVSI